MLSILIPNYNYDIRPLVGELVNQLNELSLEWEILISDDASDGDVQEGICDYINPLPYDNIKLFQQKENLGIAKNRNFLSKNATYDWVLFLDSDVMPAKKNFLEKYFELLKSDNYDLIVGNIIYRKDSSSEEKLRYVYGKAFEEKRLGKEEFSATTANFLIRKDILKEHPFQENLPRQYGHEDSLFFNEILKYKKRQIDNPVYHNKLETNEIYLEKIKQATENLEWLFRQNSEDVKNIKLVSVVRKFPLITKLLGKIFTHIEPMLTKNLLSKKPNARFIQLFKWAYFAYLQRINQT